MNLELGTVHPNKIQNGICLWEQSQTLETVIQKTC